MNKINYSLVELVREKRPLVHCITNYVTAQDVANIILACGGSPFMADHPEETAEITALCNCLLLNTGTIKENAKEAMIQSGREANRFMHPVILDPVGCGASRQRIQIILSIIREIKLTVIRGNVSEITYLLSALTNGLANPSRGVDADFSDEINEDSLIPFIEKAKALSAVTGAIVVMTGKTDIVTTRQETWLIRNGCSMMSQITGSGCMLDGVIAAYVASISDSNGKIQQNLLLEAVALATAATGLCGERASEKIKKIQGGCGTFRCYFMDEFSMLKESILKEGANIEIW